MEARKEIEADHHRGCGLSRYGLDDIPDHGDRKDNSENMGSVQHTRDFKGRVPFNSKYEVRHADKDHVVC